MEPIRKHEGAVVPLNRANVDTDQIIPKQFLKRIERSGFGQFLFYNWRFDENGDARDDFVLNKPAYQNGTILLAGENFGCGSSREHAPWSLEDYGFRVIIASSFADIFYNNAMKNGIIPVQMNEEQVQQWMKQAEKDELVLTVDLEKQMIQDGERKIDFGISPYHRENLLHGLDDIALTLQHEDKITTFENVR
ncbi:3-isopropylmalate dehydratase small subunit [Lentibacillus sp. CBA3610]|uniref:3-isopropylmalate dehydratase small subunit n=1 Tax=Lentibacillus sp. CBA3610 TaxID=2518176 RepID=UPI0015962E44|nr:3-isopropylmalate dehydratase small subunit [Lentibacillus sp. CBA3610]QKY71692.1 3-isopropylmalate dehydratase small subunit [Lentibacillus sp. CBA3610]